MLAKTVQAVPRTPAPSSGPDKPLSAWQLPWSRQAHSGDPLDTKCGYSSHKAHIHTKRT